MSVLTKFIDRIEEKISTIFLMKAKVEPSSPETLPKSEGKAKKKID